MRKLTLTLALALGSACCLGQFTGISMEAVIEHEGVVGESDLTGYTTYDIYAHFTNTTDRISIVYGKDDLPLIIATVGEVWNLEGFGGHTNSQLQPTLFTAFPELEFETVVSLGGSDSFDSEQVLLAMNSDQLDHWDETGDLVIIDEYGGGWFHSAASAGWGFDQEAGEDLKILIMRITSTTEPYGCLNIQSFIEGDQSNYDLAQNVVFGEHELLYGCLDPEALNYNENAYLDGEPCNYDAIEGDWNGDGVLDIDDVLIFLGEFGCTEDCEFDLNGDGVVNTLDLLLFFILFG